MIKPFYFMRRALVGLATVIAFGGISSGLCQQPDTPPDGSKTITADPFSERTHLTSPRQHASVSTTVSPLTPSWSEPGVSSPIHLPPMVRSGSVPSTFGPRVRNSVIPSSFNDTNSAEVRRPVEAYSLPSTVPPMAANSAGNMILPPMLQYSIELREPSGMTTAVSPDRLFHSGEQIRLHFSSLLDGHVTILQREPDGSSEMLYPQPNFRGSDWVREGIDTVVPTTGAWFIFSDPAGDLTLYVMISPTTEQSTQPQLWASNRVSAEETSNLAFEAQTGSKSLRLLLDGIPPFQTRVYNLQPNIVANLPLCLVIHLRQAY